MFECNVRNDFLKSHTYMDLANKTGKAQQSFRVKEIHEREMRSNVEFVHRNACTPWCTHTIHLTKMLEENNPMEVML